MKMITVQYVMVIITSFKLSCNDKYFKCNEYHFKNPERDEKD